MADVHILAIDLAKRSFQVCATDPGGACVFCDEGARPPTEAMIAFLDAQRDVHGVEPICKVLPMRVSD